MDNETIICCCGVSTWTIIIAWFQIVGNGLFLILAIIEAIFVEFAAVDPEDVNFESKTVVMIALAIVSMIAILGLIMGFVLLKGTNEKRVDYLKAWIRYGIIATVGSIGNMIFNTTGSSDSSTLFVVGGILGIAMNAFSIFVAYIHMKEINQFVVIP